MNFVTQWKKALPINWKTHSFVENWLLYKNSVLTAFSQADSNWRQTVFLLYQLLRIVSVSETVRDYRRRLSKGKSTDVFVIENKACCYEDF